MPPPRTKLKRRAQSKRHPRLGPDLPTLWQITQIDPYSCDQRTLMLARIYGEAVAELRDHAMKIADGLRFVLVWVQEGTSVIECWLQDMSDGARPWLLGRIERVA